MTIAGTIHAAVPGPTVTADPHTYRAHPHAHQALRAAGDAVKANAAALLIDEAARRRGGGDRQKRQRSGGALEEAHLVRGVMGREGEGEEVRRRRSSRRQVGCGLCAGVG